MQTAKAPRYSVIIELDRRVRDMEMPKYPPHALHAAMATNFRCLSSFWSPILQPTDTGHIVLLYIHRCFFAEAVSNHPANPMSSPFAPSFLAGYRNSCEILGTLRSQFDLFPAQIARLWALWAHAFSSAVRLFIACFNSPLTSVGHVIVRGDLCHRQGVAFKGDECCAGRIA